MSIRVLVADDSATIRKVVMLAFEGEQAVVETVGNGQDAVERIRLWKPDVVVADVFMPGLNGYQVCEMVKGDPALSGIPVILLVGAFEPFDEIEARRVQCDGRLMKPFDPSELVGLARSLTARPVMEGKGSTTADRVTGAGREQTAPVSRRVQESFLGPGRILELIDTTAPALRETSLRAGASDRGPAVRSELPCAPAPEELSADSGLTSAGAERSVDSDIEEALQRLAPGIVRRIAERIVPAMVELAIRKRREEGNPPESL